MRNYDHNDIRVIMNALAHTQGELEQAVTRGESLAIIECDKQMRRWLNYLLTANKQGDIKKGLKKV